MSEPLLGIEIGGTKLQMVIGDASGQISETKRFRVEAGAGAAGIRKQIEAQVQSWRTTHKFAAVGVGFGGPVDWKTGRVARSHQIEGWSGFDLAAWLGSLTGARVYADNDANVAALAEATLGAGRDFLSVFYVTLGSGVGGGLVLDRNIYHGASPGECEIGHLRLGTTGEIVESRCSGWAVDRRIREMQESEGSGYLWRATRGMQTGEASVLRDAIDKDDPAAVAILNEAAQTLAFALSHVTHLLHPEVVVIGGGLSKIGEPLRSMVELTLPGLIMEVFRPGPVIRCAGLNEQAVPVGAMVLAGNLSGQRPAG